MEVDFQKQLDEAAIKGVVRSLKVGYAIKVIEMVKSGMMPEAVFDSAIVNNEATDLILRVFNLNNTDKDVIYLMGKMASALQIPKEVIGQIVVKYFEEFSKVRFPRNFELILDCFKLPKETLGTKVLLEIITKQININDPDHNLELGRLYYFLKYFPIPAESMSELVTKAVLLYAESEKAALFDQIISSSGLSTEEVNKSVAMAMGILSAYGSLIEVWTVKNKFKMQADLIDSQALKKAALQGMRSFYYLGHDWFVKKFGLTKDDLNEEEILWWMRSYLKTKKIEMAQKMAKFAEVPNETMALLVRENLANIVFTGEKTTYSLTDKYGIPRREVIKVVKDKVMESLAGRGWLYPANYWIEEFHLPKEFVSSPRVMSAAKKGLLKAYEDGSIDMIILIKRAFGL
jgi:hypothetical protein